MSEPTCIVHGCRAVARPKTPYCEEHRGGLAPGWEFYYDRNDRKVWRRRRAGRQVIPQ